MKKRVKICLIIAFLALMYMVFASTKVNAVSIEFSDVNFYTKIKDKMKDKITNSSDENLTVTIPDDVIEETTSLQLSNCGIEDLSGIENFSNLDTLYIDGNHIKSIEKIPSENLAELHISCIEDITDIDLLKKYNNLKRLYVRNSTLEDVPDVVKSLSNLTSLSWKDGNLSSTAWVKDMPQLSNLSLDNNNIKSLENLGELKNLTMLDLPGNQIENIDGLSFCEKIKRLDISDNLIKSLNGISKLKLTSLNVSDNNITDISCIDTENLNSLNIKNNCITNLGNIQDLIVEKNFDVSGQVIKIDVKSGEKVELPAIIKQGKEKLNVTNIETINCQVESNNTCKIDENVTYARIKIEDGSLKNSIIYFNVTNVQVPGVTGNTINLTKTHIIVIIEVLILMIISVFIVAKVKNKKK